MACNPAVFRVVCLHRFQSKKRENGNLTYHVAELLIESVAGPTTSLLVGNFCGDPIAKALFIFFRELSPPTSQVSCWLQN